MTGRYVELHVGTHFSFLRGVSSCEELFSAAAVLGLPALGVVDRNSVAGIVRAWEASKATGVRLIPGCRLVLDDASELLVYPRDVSAWSRLTRLLSIGKGRAGKGGCTLGWDDVAAWCEGLVGVLVPDMADAVKQARLERIAACFGGQAYMALTLRRRADDRLRIHELDAQAREAGVRSVVAGDVLYHAPEARLLQDVVTAIRERTHDRRARLPARASTPIAPEVPGRDGRGCSPAIPTRCARASTSRAPAVRSRRAQLPVSARELVEGLTPQERSSS